MELKNFTLKGANATLPLVKSIASDITTSWNRLTAIDSELNALLCKTLEGKKVDQDNTEELKEEASCCYNKFQSGLNEMNELGAIVLELKDFAVGFTSVVNGEVIIFVYRPEEDTEIRFYRTVEIDSELQPIEGLNINEKV